MPKKEEKKKKVVAKAKPSKKKIQKVVVAKDLKKPLKKKIKKDKSYTLRSETTGDKVFLIKGGKRYWVMNPATLSKLGFRLGQEKNVDFSELKQFPEGKPLDLTRPGETVEKVEEETKKEVVEAKEAKKEASDKPYKVWS